MSILVLFLLLGVAYTKTISYYDNGDTSEPIITRGDEARICAELCLAGLGGEPCGETCLDIIPQGLLRASYQSTTGTNNASNADTEQITEAASLTPSTSGRSLTRHSACTVLCKNELGYPLCGCNTTELVLNKKPFYQVDYLSICSFFCDEYNYQIYGCPDCFGSLYKTNKLVGLTQQTDGGNIDWNAWCGRQCHEGEGGAACNCDKLPMVARQAEK